MKKSPKLENDEYQVGNFIFKKESMHIKIRDINSTFTHRISTVTTFIGRLLQITLEDKDDEALRVYATLLFNFSCTIPDKDFIVAVHTACMECVERHHDLYGVKKDITDEEDKQILEDEKGMYDFEQEVKEKEKNQ